MLISKYVCLFTIYSIMGWIYETLYCTIKGGKWENRGFLYGPVCPIYGTGAVAISLIISFTDKSGIVLHAWHVFVISVIGSAVLEYFTSWALEKIFHALWWDYSRLPFNIHGRVSLFTSLGFGCGGLLIAYKIVPFTENAMELLIPTATECLALLFVFLFAVDITLTATALLHFDQLVMHIEESFNQNMDTLVDGAASRTNRIKEQMGSLSVFIKTAIRRTYSFRDNNKKKENIKNHLLTVAKKKHN